jgi:hypothetical protein
LLIRRISPPVPVREEEFSLPLLVLIAPKSVVRVIPPPSEVMLLVVMPCFAVKFTGLPEESRVPVLC